MHMVGDHHHSVGVKPAFRAALMQSGAPAPWVSKSMPEAEAVFDAILRRVACPPRSSGPAEALSCLLSRSTLDVYNASYAAELGDLPFADSWSSCQWAPVVDGVELSAAPTELLRRWGAPAGVHAIVGSNEDEGTQGLYLGK